MSRPSSPLDFETALDEFTYDAEPLLNSLQFFASMLKNDDEASYHWKEHMGTTVGGYDSGAYALYALLEDFRRHFDGYRERVKVLVGREPAET